jgi:DNA-binding IclR family transcriptional regulator
VCGTMISSTMSTPNASASSTDRQFANTLERGLRVLRCFSSSQPELSNREISEATDLPKATVSRLTHTLIELGYLRRRPDSTHFELSTGVLSLGYPVLAGLIQLRRAALPPMAALAKEIDGVSAMAIRDRLQMVLIETVIERDVLRRKHGAGLTRDIVGNTGGVAWVVGASAAERERVFRDIEHHTPGALATWREELDRCFTQYLRHGYVTGYGKLRPNTLVVSTPLKRHAGEEVLVLSCALVAPAAQAEAMGLVSGAKLVATARAIEAARAAG